MLRSEVLAELSVTRSTHPEEALAAADTHREALVEPLLLALEQGIRHPGSASEAEANLFSYALYLFARWREPRASRLVVRWLSLPEEGPFEIAGDIVTQDGASILAAVCGTDLEPIKGLVLNRHANEWGRSAGIAALAHVATWDSGQRNAIVDYFLSLATEGLERKPSAVWDSLAAASADIEARRVFPAIRRAYAEGLVDPRFMAESELDAVDVSPPGEELRRTQDRRQPVDDVIRATSWWGCFAKPREASPRYVPVRISSKVGRNQPCPCGSGKKFKKCCGGVSDINPT